jgi:large subunit ribosomal protein L15
MKLHGLSSIQKKTQRIGRGGKRGSYSGRGVKGQKSRAGRRIRPAERDLIIRLPKLRGFRNKEKSEKPEVFNIGELSSALASFAKAKEPIIVTKEFLKTAKVLSKRSRGEVKILGNGEITFPISVSGISVSESAKKKIEKAGGSVK